MKLTEDGQGNLIPGAWRQNMQLTDTEAATAGRPNYEGKVQRNYLMDYYNSNIGRVPWQDDIVNKWKDFYAPKKPKVSAKKAVYFFLNQPKGPFPPT